MLLTPGPGWLAIGGGLAVLASEFLWARRLLDQLKRRATRLRG
jgi:putative transmembrane protein PGPGW